MGICTAKSFSESFEVQYRCIEQAIKFDIDAIKNDIESEPDNRCKSTMLFLLEQLQPEKNNDLKKNYKILNKRDSEFLSFNNWKFTVSFYNYVKVW